MFKTLFKHKNTPFILALALPLLMILLVAISIWVPPMFYTPKYNFIYSVDTQYYGSEYLVVEQKRLVDHTPVEYIGTQQVQLYHYDVKSDTSTPISFIDAQKYALLDSEESPDGYKVVSGHNNEGFFPFYWGGNFNGETYMVNNFSSKKLKVIKNSIRNYEPIHFLGWIQNE